MGGEEGRSDVRQGDSEPSLDALIQAVDIASHKVHPCRCAQKVSAMLDCLAAHVSQEQCRYSDEVRTSQAGRIESETHHLWAELVAVPPAVAETDGVQIANRGAVGDLAEQ